MSPSSCVSSKLIPAKQSSTSTRNYLCFSLDPGFCNLYTKKELNNTQLTSQSTTSLLHFMIF
jgi:hypothetical protein